MTDDEILEEEFWVPLPPVATHRCVMIPEKEYNEQQAYIARLEAAYLEAKYEWLKWKEYNEFGPAEKSEDELMQEARESLERIKAGDTK